MLNEHCIATLLPCLADRGNCQCRLMLKANTDASNRSIATPVMKVASNALLSVQLGLVAKRIR